jgi:MFS family permease
MITTGHVHLKDAHKTKQFWLIWAVLCLNVSAGIGVLGMASPMLQEIFAGKLIGKPEIAFASARRRQKRQIATIAAAFVGLLSLFNIAGRFFWASLSDKLGRKLTYYTFFGWASCSMACRPGLRGMGSWRCSSPSSASSCRCMAAASRRSRPISPTCSARSSSAPSMAGC